MQHTLDVRAARQLYRSWQELRAGGNAKWFLEDLNYMIPEDAQRIVEAAEERTYFYIACDWTELAKEADDPFEFVEQTLRKHGVDLTIERPPAPPPDPEVVAPVRAPRRTQGGPQPSAFTSDLSCTVKLVDAWRPDQDLGETPGSVDLPSGSLWCVRPTEVLFGEERRAWTAAVDQSVRGLDLRVSLDDDELRHVLGNADLEVLLLDFGTSMAVLAEEVQSHPSLTMLSVPELPDDVARALASALSRLPRLRIIDMRTCLEPFTADAFAALARIERVEALRLGWFDDELAATLATFTQLRSLDLAACDAELSASTFAQLPPVSVLVAPSSTSSAEVLAAIAALPHLTTLDLRAATGLEPSELPALATSRVNTLHVSELTDLDALAALAAMPQLTTLDLADVGFDADVGDVLEKFPTLRTVYVGNDDDLVATLTARFPSIRFAWRT